MAADLLQFDAEGIRGVSTSINTAKESIDTAITNMYGVIRGFGKDEWSGPSYNNFVKHCDEFESTVKALVSALEEKKTDFDGYATGADNAAAEVDAAVDGAFV